MHSTRPDFKNEMLKQNEAVRAEVDVIIKRLASVDPQLLRRVGLAFRILALVITSVVLGVYLAGMGEVLDMVSIGYMCVLAVIAGGFVPAVSKDWRYGVAATSTSMAGFVVIPLLAGTTALTFGHVFALALGVFSVVQLIRMNLRTPTPTISGLAEGGAEPVSK